MKKRIGFILCLLLLYSLLIPVSASVEPEITQQPQSTTFKEFGVASYSVTVKGKYLKCRWYMRFNGDIYDLCDLGNGMNPWEHYAGSSYGPYSNTEGEYTTFTYYFNGIDSELDGCYLYAEIEDGHFSITSEKAYIRVTPYEEPEIVINVPSSIEVYQGDILDLYCSATASDGSSLDYLWYSCSTGNIENIIAVNRGSEDQDTLRVDTGYVGTQYYTCYVSTSSYGAYSDMIRVTVLEKKVDSDPPEITTKYLPDATVGENYYVKLNCTNADVEYGIYYNPGKANDFQKTGLILTQHGEIEGVPTKAGTYGFTVTVVDEDDQQGYQIYTLKINEAPEATEPEQTEATESEKEVTEIIDSPPESIDDPDEEIEPPSEDTGTGSTENTGGFQFDFSPGAIVILILFIGLCLLIPVLLIVVIVIIIVKKKKTPNEET